MDEGRGKRHSQMATWYLEHRKTGGAKSTTVRTLSVTATEAMDDEGGPKA